MRRSQAHGTPSHLQQRSRPTPTPPDAGRRIVRVEVDKLFGYYDYTIPAPSDEAPLGDVVILYGDNGSGKTTLLKLIFHLLSAANNRGHRSSLYEIPFQRLLVVLNDGSNIGALRTKGITGELLLYVQTGSTEIRGTYTKSKNPDKAGGFKSPAFEKEFITALESLKLTLYHLADDRQLTSDSLPEASDAQEQLQLQFYYQHIVEARAGDIRLLPPPRHHLVRTLNVAHEWIRSQMIRAANVGSETANSIYLNIAKSLSAKAPVQSHPEKADRVLEILSDLQIRGSAFARFGFTPSLDVDQMREQLASVRDERREVMATIFEPYLNGLVARLESLSNIQRATEKLVDGLTTFFANKRVEFDVDNGFRFSGPDGAPIQPEWLSSGEGHLVRLFCCTLVSRDRPSLFLVDEPELSLNIKWQRTLIRALTDLAAGSWNQFIFATHSMEILSQHRGRVVELRPRPGVNDADS